MRNYFIIFFTSALLAMFGIFSSAVQAAEAAIRVTSIAQIEIEVTGIKGEKSIKRTSVDKALPGTEVIYTTQFKNVLTTAASNIVIDNPIPKNTEYKAGSVFGENCEILFSVNGGKQYAHAEDLKSKDKDGNERTALPMEYTHIRWTHKGQLTPGKSSEVGFRATIK